ncbi:MAG: SdrD B-like domain-containing protein [Pirellulales bacterium]
MNGWRSRAVGRKRPRTRLESLERRIVPAQFAVNVLVDAPDATAAGDGVVDVDLQTPGLQVSLRGAVSEAAALAGDDQINLPAGRYVLSSPLIFNDSTAAVTVTGAGMETILDANRSGRVIQVQNNSNQGSGPRVTLQGMVIRGGQVTDTPGSGILNSGQLTIEDVWVTDNLAGGDGGGLANFGQATILRSTFSANQAGLLLPPVGRGGGVFHSSSSTLTIVNSTFSDNAALSAQSSRGGGIYFDFGIASLQFVTVTGNRAIEGGGLFATTSTKVQLQHTLVAENQATSDAAGPDLRGSFASSGFNLIGNLGPASIGVDPTNLVGGAGQPAIIPLLQGLSDPADGIPVHVPEFTSPAVDAGSTELSSLTTDQRGTLRPVDADRNGVAAADIGAIEIDPRRLIAGQAWIDRLRDGVTGDDRPLIERRVDLLADDGNGLFDAADQPVATTTTSGQGQFAFAPQPAGIYWVSLTVGSAEIVTSPESASSVIRVALSDADRTDLEFALFTPPTVVGVVREDLQGDGAGDLPLTGITVQLFADDGDNLLGPSDTLVQTAIANSSGDYQLIAQRGGRYFINPVAPAGAYIPLGPRTVPYRTVELASGDELSELDFPVTFLSSVSGRVVTDVTGNGISADDQPRAGELIRLLRDDGDGQLNIGRDTLIATATTGADGAYRFDSLEAGRYFVDRQARPHTIQTAGGTAPRAYFDLNLVSRSNTTGDFGVADLGAVRGSVWEDANGNGQRDAGERPLVEWPVELINTQTGVTLSGLTNADGVYEFLDLVPAEYRVEAEQRPSYLASAPVRSYSQWAYLPTAPLAGSVATGNLSGDDAEELVVANEYPARVTIVRATSDGGLALEPISQIPLDNSMRPKRVVLTDLDGDGDLDAVIASIQRPELLSPLDPHRLDGALQILRNAGQGRMVLDPSIPVDGGAADVVAGDWNGDGRADLAAIGFRTNDVTVWLQSAGGQFTVWRQWTGGGTPVSIDALDVNQDGLADFAVGIASTGRVEIWASGLDGQHTLAGTLTGIAGPYHLAWAQLVAGSSPDLVVTQHNSDQLLIFTDLAVRGGVLQPTSRTEIPAGGTGATHVDVRDLNGDSRLDLLVADSTSPWLSVLYGLGDSQFSAPFVVGGPWTDIGELTGPRHVVAAQLNSSPGLELVAADITGGVLAWESVPPIYLTTVGFGETSESNDFGMVPLASTSSPQVVTSTTTTAGNSVPQPLDVNGDGRVSPIDALLVINRLNRLSSAAATPLVATQSAAGAQSEADPFDTSGDGRVSPIDALLVINYLNRQAANAATASAILPAPANLTAVMASPEPISAVVADVPVADSMWSSISAAIDAVFSLDASKPLGS